MVSTPEQELVDILLELGYVHQEQINEALELQKVRPKRLDALLSDLGYVQEEHLLEHTVHDPEKERDLVEK